MTGLVEKPEVLGILKQIATGIEQLLHPYCEVVIHDFTDLEESIVHIEGDVSGRSPKGAATDLLLTSVRSGNTENDFYNYRTRLPNHTHMKSCTMFLRDTDGRAYGAFCINFDIGVFLQMNRALETFIATDDAQEISETLSDDIHKTIHTMLMETIRDTDKDLPIMNRDEKVDLIARLDERGVFQIKKAASILVDELGWSRATIYNYLGEARAMHKNDDDGVSDDDI